MRLPCETVVRYYLPYLRSLIAKTLFSDYGWKQEDIAKSMMVTQSAVSKYIKRDYSVRGLDRKKVEEYAKKMARMIALGEMDNETFISMVCEECLKMRIFGPICKIHKESVPLPDSCDICQKSVEKKFFDERKGVIKNIEKALDVLYKERGYYFLVPEVRTNIAMAIEGARSISDVAAIPGRITVIRNKLYAPLPPEFGASSHLSKILLNVMKRRPSIRAITCIKYNKVIDEAMKRLGMDTILVERKGSKKDFSEILRGKEIPERVDALIDPGGGGIEPVVYVLGKDALDCVKKACRILEMIEL
ncbi:MAG: thiamine-phosphate synthase family protein [Candidatus Asgardarchaeia archaeon]